jgi:hypothetical protein
MANDRGGILRSEASSGRPCFWRQFDKVLDEPLRSDFAEPEPSADEMMPDPVRDA